MARYSAGNRATSIGTTARPMLSIAAAAAVGGVLREVGVFNTTVTDVSVKLVRLTAAGTPGTGVTPNKYDNTTAAASCVVSNAHTADATVVDAGYRADLGASIGAGVIWTFGADGLRIPVGVANGLGVILATGTGQLCDIYFVWDE